MPGPLTPAAIQAILDGGTFEQFKGAVEDEFLECKGAPYQLADDPQKVEIAKDVSAFANKSGRLNVDGGYILIGVRTKKSSEHHGDTVEAISPFDQGLVLPQQYHDVLGAWLVAVPEDVSVKWYPSATEPTKGIVGIRIPKQRSELWPFLITKVVEAGKLTGTLVGYYERRRDVAAPIPPYELQRLFRDGRRFDSIVPGLIARLAALEERPREPPRASSALEHHRQRRGLAVAAAGLNGKPTFALTAAPLQATTLPTLFRGPDDPLVRLLNHPPGIRDHGFDIDAGTTEIVEGQFRRAVIPERLHLECWSDGTLIFVAEAQDFLCWGPATTIGGGLRINPLALIESTYLFCNLSHLIYRNHANPRPQGVEFSLTLYEMERNGQMAAMTPGPLDSHAHRFGHDVRTVPQATGEFLERATGDRTPEGAAYLLVQRVYTWLGFEEDDIPYVEEVDSERRISVEKIRTARP